MFQGGIHIRSRTIGVSVLATTALFGLTTACLPGSWGKAADTGRAARAAEQASNGATPSPTAKNKDKSTGVLADRSSPPSRGTRPGRSSFPAFGTPVDTALPDGADVLDLSKLGGGVPGESV